MTDVIPAVYGAICEVSGTLAKAGISKDRKNLQQGYQFRGIDDVYNALAPVLSAAKLCILPRVLSRTVAEGATKAGGVLYYVVCDVEFDLVCATDGSRHTVRTCGEAMDSADKATNKAMSAAYKYMAMQVFCIPTQGDNDADAHTPEPASRRQPTASEPRYEPPSPPPPPREVPRPDPGHPGNTEPVSAADLRKYWFARLAECYPANGTAPAGLSDTDRYAAQLGLFGHESLGDLTDEERAKVRKKLGVTSPDALRAACDKFVIPF